MVGLVLLSAAEDRWSDVGFKKLVKQQDIRLKRSEGFYALRLVALWASHLPPHSFSSPHPHEAFLTQSVISTPALTTPYPSEPSTERLPLSVLSPILCLALCFDGTILLTRAFGRDLAESHSSFHNTTLKTKVSSLLPSSPLWFLHSLTSWTRVFSVSFNFLYLASNSASWGFCYLVLSIRKCEILFLIESHRYIDLILSFPFVSLPLSSLSLSPFIVMGYFIDILGVWDRAMTLQLCYPFEMH